MAVSRSNWSLGGKESEDDDDDSCTTSASSLLLLVVDAKAKKWLDFWENSNSNGDVGSRKEGWKLLTLILGGGIGIIHRWKASAQIMLVTQIKANSADTRGRIRFMSYTIFLDILCI